jgi:endonuclease-3
MVKIITGAYILILKMEIEKDIQIGKFKKFSFKKGYYFYVGSAMKGFGRVYRHFKVAQGINKTRKWHIDYLLPCIKVESAILVKTNRKVECLLSKCFFESYMEIIPGFGCTDCYCKTHLYYSEEDVKNKVAEKSKLFGRIEILNYNGQSLVNTKTN